MKVMIEMSYYPLADNAIEQIKGFIDKLKTQSEFEINVNDMSTQIKGDFKTIMNILPDLMTKEFQQNKASFVMKIISRQSE